MTAPASHPSDAGRPGWFDSHCHLQDQYRGGERSALDAVREAAASGVTGLVCVGTDAETSRQAVALTRSLRAEADRDRDLAGFGAWATVGLHPHDASEGLDAVEAELRAGCELKAGAAPSRNDRIVVAVGECGLDYHYDHSPRHQQREMFAAQIGLARSTGLTLVVHSRAAWDDTIAILRAEGVPERTVMHCFTGGPDEASRCLDLGAFLSFSGIVTFKNADDVRAAAMMCPLDRLLVETDAPFLAPVPYRGESNRPALVAVVGDAVAAVRRVAPDELAAATAHTAATAFALG
jgi:TatD DNase family protein